MMICRGNMIHLEVFSTITIIILPSVNICNNHHHHSSKCKYLQQLLTSQQQMSRLATITTIILGNVNISNNCHHHNSKHHKYVRFLERRYCSFEDGDSWITNVLCNSQNYNDFSDGIGYISIYLQQSPPSKQRISIFATTATIIVANVNICNNHHHDNSKCQYLQQLPPS